MRINIIIVCLIALTASSYWFLDNLEDELNIELDEENQVVRPVIIANNVSARYFGENDTILYELISGEVTEYSNKSGTEFTLPYIVAFDENNHVEWEANSDKARLSSDKKNMVLIDNVKLIQEPDSDLPITVTAVSLDYNESTNLVTSNKPVTIQDGIIKQVSENFRLDIKTEKISFSDGVTADYKTIPKFK